MKPSTVYAIFMFAFVIVNFDKASADAHATVSCAGIIMFAMHMAECRKEKAK